MWIFDRKPIVTDNFDALTADSLAKFVLKLVLYKATGVIKTKYNYEIFFHGALKRKALRATKMEKKSPTVEHDYALQI